MIKKTTNILIPFIAGVVLLGVGFILGRYAAQKNTLTPTSLATATSTAALPAITLPDNVFDATETIPGTSISVSYPKKGFWELGAVVDERFAYPTDIPDAGSGSYGSFTIRPSGSVAQENGPFILQVEASRLTTSKTLQEAVASYSSIDGIDLQDASKLGTYVSINGHEFVVFKDASGYMLPGVGSTWHGLSFSKNEAISVSFSFAAENTSSSEMAFRSDDQLFFQILSHVSFK